MGKRPNDRPSRDHLQSGAWAELIATSWLLELGFEVFRNVAAFGPVDLIGLKDGQTYLFDVKTVDTDVRHSIGGADLKPKQIHLGVKLIFVTAEGLCAFERSELREKLKLFHGDIPRQRWGNFNFRR